MEGPRARVERGAALLDDRRPGWARRVAPDRLMMMDCNACVLGQVGGEYGPELCRLFGAEYSRTEGLPDGAPRWAVDHGFYPDRGLLGRDMNALADLWRAAIRARTGGAS